MKNILLSQQREPNEIPLEPIAKGLVMTMRLNMKSIKMNSIKPIMTRRTKMSLPTMKNYKCTKEHQFKFCSLPTKILSNHSTKERHKKWIYRFAAILVKYMSGPNYMGSILELEPSPISRTRWNQNWITRANYGTRFEPPLGYGIANN